LDQIDFEQVYRSKNMGFDKGAKKKWLESFITKIQFRREHRKEIDPRVKDFLITTTVMIPNQPNPMMPMSEHEKHHKLNAAQVIIGLQKTYKFATAGDQVLGKINASGLKAWKHNQTPQYERSLIKPQSYEMAHNKKTVFLVELAKMCTNWVGLIDDVNQAIQSLNIIPVTEGVDKEDVNDANFDLQKILDLNQVNIKQAQELENVSLNVIRAQLGKEVNNKLALMMNPQLNGAVTWVACVICWFKLQDNVISNFNRNLAKFEAQKSTWKSNFMQIAAGKGSKATQSGAQQTFDDVWITVTNTIDANERKKVTDFLRSKQIVEQFDTNTVYDQMEYTYVKNPKLEEYEKQIGFMHAPVDYFWEHVKHLQTVLIDDQLLDFCNKYHGRLRNNLRAFSRRVECLQRKFAEDETFRDPCRLFEIRRGGVQLEYQAKQDLLLYMSPVLFPIFIKALAGTYKLQKNETFKKMMPIGEGGKQDEVEFTVITHVEGSQQVNRDLAVEDQTEPSALVKLQNIDFAEGGDVNLDLVKMFEVRGLEMCSQEKNAAVCLDFIAMAEKLLQCVKSKLEKVDDEDSRLKEAKKSGADLLKVAMPVIDQNVKHDISTMMHNACGCRAVCAFCRRKCEKKPHSEKEQHCCDRLGHQMRVFGNGFFVGPKGERYPSLKVCDEIDGNTTIQIEQAGKASLSLWETVHAQLNLGWKRSYTKFEEGNKEKLSKTHLEMRLKMDKFWNVLGPRFCEEPDPKEKPARPPPRFAYIAKANDMEDERTIIREDTLCIVNLDNSGSMFWSPEKYGPAVKGAQTAVEYLKSHHVQPNRVRIQLWQNDNPGVKCVYKDFLSRDRDIPDEKWINAHNQSQLAEQCEGCYREGQFGSSINILRYEALKELKMQDYPLVFYFFFTDGGNSYPVKQVSEFGKELAANKAYWTNPTGKPKLQMTLVTDCPNVDSLTEMKRELDKFGNSIWGVQDWCQLKTSVATDQWGAAMIEQFKIS